MNAKLILSVVVAGLVVLFVVQNVGAVEIRFLFWSFSASGSLLFLLIFFIGAVLGWSWHRLSELDLNSKFRNNGLSTATGRVQGEPRPAATQAAFACLRKYEAEAAAARHERRPAMRLLDSRQRCGGAR